MTTYTVVGLINEAGDELYVAGVFLGQQMNQDKNVDAQVGDETMDQFVGFFDATDADEAAELARDVIAHPIAPPQTGRTLTRRVEDAGVKTNLI